MFNTDPNHSSLADQILCHNNPKQILIDLLTEKERVLNNLSQQITKYKSEALQNHKLIQHLQDKINTIAPSTTNTTSTFMMASEFRTNFEQLMTSSLPTALASLTDRPMLFRKCTADIFTFHYNSVQQKLRKITQSICAILNIQQEDSAEVQSRVKLTLIKVLQQCWEKILPFNQQQKLQYIGSTEQEVDQLNQILEAEDFLTLQQHLHRLVVYMILQDKPWRFAEIHQTQQPITFSKKDHVCIDGWIKEAEQAILVLAGIKRDAQLHPNLKNYVLPHQQNQTLPSQLTLVVRGKPKLMKEQPTTVQTYTNIAKKPITVPPCQLISKNASWQHLQENKQNCPLPLNKKSKKKDRNKLCLDSSNQTDRQFRHKAQKYSQKNQTAKIQYEDIQIHKNNNKIDLPNSQLYAKTTFIVNSLANQKSVDEFPKQKNYVQQLPMSREPCLKKRNKAQTSRKASAGKIVSQHHMLNHAQQTQKQFRPKPKQKIYKELIKQKLLEDRLLDREKGSVKAKERRKEDNRNSKQQNRPLKLQTNANRLREKYIN